MHRSQKCYSELAEFTVNDIWQITDAGEQELRRLAHCIRWRTVDLDELAELTVDDIWQIADAGDQELGRLAHSIGEIPWSSMPKTMMDCHCHSSLSCTRWGITSQCRSSCISRDRLWYLSSYRLREFHQIYNLDAVGIRVDLIGHWYQKFKRSGSWRNQIW